MKKDGQYADWSFSSIGWCSVSLTSRLTEIPWYDWGQNRKNLHFPPQRPMTGHSHPESRINQFMQMLPSKGSS